MQLNSTINYSETGFFSKLLLGYLDGKNDLNSFYEYAPTLESFKTSIDQKGNQKIERSLLVEVLKEQYQSFKTSEMVMANIEKLAQSNTFTVTTGHQLCLFTGPLYFIYKLVTTINLAKALKRACLLDGNRGS